jgi:hypothetical protein
MYRSSWRPKRFHDHDHSEIAIILKGRCTHLFEGQSVPVRAGDLLVVHPGSTHTYDQFEQLEMVNIVYDARRLYLPILDGSRMPLFQILFPDDPEKIHRSAEPVLHLEPNELETIAGMIRNMELELKSARPGSNLYSLAVFLQIVVMLCRLYSGTDQLKTMPFQIGEAVAYINTHYRLNITIAQLARKACMSRRNLFLQFKKPQDAVRSSICSVSGSAGPRSCCSTRNCRSATLPRNAAFPTAIISARSSGRKPACRHGSSG